MDTPQTKVLRDAYFFIDVTWKSGFQHRVPARGYELKSWLAHLERNNWIERAVYSETTAEEFNQHCYEKPATKAAPAKKPAVSKKNSSKTPQKPKKTVDKAPKKAHNKPITANTATTTASRTKTSATKPKKVVDKKQTK